MKPLKRKTGSTESAWLLLALMSYVVFQENTELVEVIIWPFITYASIAFGLKRVDLSDKLWGSKPN
jgi:hypothetical protein